MLIPLICMLAAGAGAVIMYVGMSVGARAGRAVRRGAGTVVVPSQSRAALQRFRAAVDQCHD